MSDSLQEVVVKVVHELSRAIFGPSGYLKQAEPMRGQDAVLKTYRDTQIAPRRLER